MSQEKQQQEQQQYPNNNNDNGNICHVNITMLVPGFFDDYYNYLDYHAENYMQNVNPNVTITLQKVDGDLVTLQDELLKHASQQQTWAWDGSLFPAQFTGRMVQANTLLDLTTYVQTSMTIDWEDMLFFFRQQLAVYDKKVRVIPLDGDLLLLYYRKDLFDRYNIQIPKTWQDYTNIAKFFHNKTLNEIYNTTIYDDNTDLFHGSCVSRINRCGNAFWASLILSSMTQYNGTSSGFLLDPTTLQPLFGPAMEETLFLLQEQLQYGSPTELTADCLEPNNEFSAGTCAMTYNWGNQVDIDLLDANFTIGVTQTPGSATIYNRQTQQLEPCTIGTCRYGKILSLNNDDDDDNDNDDVNNDDITVINMAPYAAYGGWVGAVSNFSPKAKQIAMTEFLSYISNSKQSLFDVLPNNRSTFSQPYRYSHSTLFNWMDTIDEHSNDNDNDNSYLISFVEDYLHSTRQIDDPNTVLELRIPFAAQLRDVLDQHVFDFLNNSTIKTQTRQDIQKVTQQLQQDIQHILDKENANGLLLEQYQRSLGIYKLPASTHHYIHDSIRIIGWTMGGFICFLALCLMVWAKRNHDTPIVQQAPTQLLYQKCIGYFLMGTTILLLGYDESILQQHTSLNNICLAIPWSFVMGLSFFISAVWTKIRHCLYIIQQQQGKQGQQEQANYDDYYDGDDKNMDKMINTIPNSYRFAPLLTLCCLNGSILTIWTIVDPIMFIRQQTSLSLLSSSMSQVETRLPDTYGICKGTREWNNIELYILFASLLGFVNVIICLFLIYQSYNGGLFSNWKQASKYNDIRWSPLSLVPFLEVWVVGGPMLLLVRDDPTGIFVLATMIIVVGTFASMSTLFIPKLNFMRKKITQRSMDQEGDEGIDGDGEYDEEEGNNSTTSSAEDHENDLHENNNPEHDVEREKARLQTQIDNCYMTNQELECEIRMLQAKLKPSIDPNDSNDEIDEAELMIKEYEMEMSPIKVGHEGIVDTLDFDTERTGGELRMTTGDSFDDRHIVRVETDMSSLSGGEVRRKIKVPAARRTTTSPTKSLELCVDLGDDDDNKNNDDYNHNINIVTPDHKNNNDDDNNDNSSQQSSIIPIRPSSQVKMGEWTPVGGVAAVIADMSSDTTSSYSSHSFSSRTESVSSHYKSASSSLNYQDQPKASDIESLVAKRDWEGVREVVKDLSETFVATAVAPAGDDSSRKNNNGGVIEEKRRKKRDIEKWRESITKSFEQPRRALSPTKQT